MDQAGAAVQADCIFCRIAKKEIPAEFLSETADSLVIKDRAPAAKDHVLVIAKEHASDITKANDWDLTIHLAYTYATEHMPGGFRIVINTGDDAGQTVKHFHVHVLGGEKLGDL